MKEPSLGVFGDSEMIGDTVERKLGLNTNEFHFPDALQSLAAIDRQQGEGHGGAEAETAADDDRDAASACSLNCCRRFSARGGQQARARGEGG